MNFKYKAYVQKKISDLPYGEKINYFFQKHITKSLPITDEEFHSKVNYLYEHFKYFTKYSHKKDPQNCSYYEFGAGYDLVIPIGISLLGFNKIICIDIKKIAFPDLIKNTICRYREYQGKLPFVYDLPDEAVNLNSKNFKEYLFKNFNIEYRAPVDARNTGISCSSIDYTLTNATLEHVSSDTIVDILKESFRILKPGGVMTNIIDYRDHFSFFDKSISSYNFLQYSKEEWKKLNPDIMHQNRMRHKEYINIVKEIGFEIVEENVNMTTDEELIFLKKFPLHDDFKCSFSLEEIGIKSSFLVLRKPD